jgi:hypothetical protein
MRREGEMKRKEECMNERKGLREERRRGRYVCMYVCMYV